MKLSSVDYTYSKQVTLLGVNQYAVLVGKPAPDFTAAAVTGSGEIIDNFNLAETIKGKKQLSSLSS